MDALATNFTTTNETSMDLLLSLLDEAIDDYKNGNVISEEEMLAELASLDKEV